MAGISTIQDVTRLDYNGTLDINDSSGTTHHSINEIYSFTHEDNNEMEIRVAIDTDGSDFDVNVLLRVETDTRRITFSGDEAKYPLNKTELYLGADIQQNQMSALVHELVFTKFSNSSIFTFSGEETGDYNGETITLRKYSATNQYLCTS